jgi:hypothetical protein
MTPYPLVRHSAAHLNELINSRITLTDKEAALVEDFLFSIQSQVNTKYLNSAKGLRALRTN